VREKSAYAFTTSASSFYICKKFEFLSIFSVSALEKCLHVVRIHLQNYKNNIKREKKSCLWDFIFENERNHLLTSCQWHCTVFENKIHDSRFFYKFNILSAFHLTCFLFFTFTKLVIITHRYIKTSKY
jgi:hypothetical protein